MIAYAEGIYPDMELTRLTAEADDVDDTGHLLELALEDPVLRGLEVAQRVALPLERVAVDLADRIPRGDRRLVAVRQVDEAEAIDHLLASIVVAGSPSEVALHVR